jgi:hypothetical protein
VIQVPTEKRIDEIAKILDLTSEEVLQMLTEDKEIDRGADLYGLPPDKEKASKQARQVAKAPSTTPTKRERKKDNDKRFLIDALGECLWGHGAEGTVATNPERQLDFEFNGRKFRLVLSAPRD